MDRFSSEVVHVSEMVCAIVSAYVANNSVPANDLPNLIALVHRSVVDTRSHGHAPEYSAAGRDAAIKPSVSRIHDSIQRDGIVSFLDGKPYKTLKRHLTANGLDPASYRERYGLPHDYPMVAKEYAERRSVLAKQIRLGQVNRVVNRGRKDRTAA